MTILEYTMPISEAVKQEDGGVRITGTAIAAVTSRNKRKYLAEELSPSMSTMEGRPIGLNHSGDVTDNVGLVSETSFDGTNGLYAGTVYNTAKHPGITDMVEKRLIQHVSIEADVKNIETVKENGESVHILRGITFTGLDFVKTPGIETSSVGIAEALDKHLKEANPMENKEEKVEKTTEPTMEELVAKAVAEAFAKKDDKKKPEGEDEEEEPDKKKAAKPADKEKPKESVEAKVNEATEKMDELAQRVEKLTEALKKEKAKGIGVVEGNKQSTSNGIKFYEEDGYSLARHEDFFGYESRRV